jgi:hypothetical protein
MTNNRVFWAIEQLAFKANSASATSGVAAFNARNYATGALASGVNEVNGLWEVPRGVQSAGMSTTFNLQQVFQLGQIELYEYSERQPDVEMTISKCVDGTKPLFLMVTDPAFVDITGKTANYRVDVAFQIYPDTKFRATGKPVSICTGSGMYLSNISYTYPIDGFVTEDITLVGNDKIWGSFINVSGVTAGNGGSEQVLPFPTPGFNGNVDPNAPKGAPSGAFGHDGNTSVLIEGGAFEVAGGTDRFGVIVVGSGVARREEVDISHSILPRDIPGVITANISGINAAYVNGGFGSQGPGTASASTQLIADANTDYIAEHIQTITVSFSVARRDIFELGSLRPFVKVPEYPLEATASIAVITAQGDLVDATSAIDCGPGNTAESNTIIIRTCDGLQVDLGDSNRLTGVEVAGGEAGGDDMTVTYNYSSFNNFYVSHDFFQPNHRVVIFGTGRSRFNVGKAPFRRSDIGLF